MKAIRESMKSFDDTIFEYTIEIAIGIVFNRFDSNIVGHRDYNKLTLVGIDLINFIADKLGKKMIEVDVKNCFPRIVYALNGLDLPDDFYGVDRQKNKKRINIALNSFRLDENKNRSESKQRADNKAMLLNVGIDSRVVNWLMGNHFNNTFKGDFFNFLAYHERCIIGAAIDKLSSYEPDINFYRRHDSFIVFEDVNYRCLDTFDYLGYKGWFDSYKINEDNNDFLF